MAPPVLALVGLTSASFLAGKLFTQSWSTVPALLHAPPPLLARQWRTMFHRDIYLAPAEMLLSSGIWGYLAYKLEPQFESERLLFAVAASVTTLMAPYSAILLEPINRMLEQRARTLSSPARDLEDVLEKGLIGTDEVIDDVLVIDHDDEDGEIGLVWERQSVHVLVDRWATINAGRAVIAGIAVILAGSATLAL